jgi:hypothetical protein
MEIGKDRDFASTGMLFTKKENVEQGREDEGEYTASYPK